MHTHSLLGFSLGSVRARVSHVDGASGAFSAFRGLTHHMGGGVGVVPEAVSFGVSCVSRCPDSAKLKPSVENPAFLVPPIGLLKHNHICLWSSADMADDYLRRTPWGHSPGAALNCGLYRGASECQTWATPPPHACTLTYLDGVVPLKGMQFRPTHFIFQLPPHKNGQNEETPYFSQELGSVRNTP